MSYTLFEYSNLKLDKTTIGKDETLTVTITVKNVGEVFGSEVVQFYISDTQSYIKRPLKELKGFTKVHLQPKQSKTITFVVDKYAISYFDEDKSSWIAEKGEFKL